MSREKLGVLIAVVVLAIFLVSAYLRNRVWADERSLWSDTAGKSPHRARAHLNLCVFYSGAGNWAAALDHCDRAIELKQEPFLTRDAYINRGAIRSDLEQYPNALQDYAAALQLFPDDWKIFNNIAYVHARLGDLDHAIEQYSRAIALNPQYENALFNRAVLYAHQQRYLLAIEDFTRALMIDPSSAITYEKRAHAYLAVGDARRAAPDLQKACMGGRQEACATKKKIGL